MAKRSFKIGGKVSLNIAGDWCRGTITSRSYKNETVTVRVRRKYYEIDMNSFM